MSHLSHMIVFTAEKPCFRVSSRWGAEKFCLISTEWRTRRHLHCLKSANKPIGAGNWNVVKHICRGQFRVRYWKERSHVVLARLFSAKHQRMRSQWIYRMCCCFVYGDLQFNVDVKLIFKFMYEIKDVSSRTRLYRLEVMWLRPWFCHVSVIAWLSGPVW